MLGNVLKEARERENLSITDIEKETSIRRAYIEAIEAENWEVLPSPVYVRGFIRNLANFLNVDGNSLIEDYNNIVRGQVNNPDTSHEDNNEEEKKNSPATYNAPHNENVNVSLNNSPKKKKSNAFLYLILILALVGVGAFYFMDKNASNSGQNIASVSQEEKGKNASNDKKVTEPAKNSPTKITEPLTQNAQNNQQPQTNQPSAPQQAQQTPQVTQTQPITTTGVEIIGKFNGNCWVKVVVDGNVVFEDIAEDGSNHTWKGNEKIYILTGNAGAMEIVHNGKDIGSMGDYGQVAEKVFTK